MTRTVSSRIEAKRTANITPWRPPACVSTVTAEGLLLLRTWAPTVPDTPVMVAVWLPERNETTLKYFFREGDRVRLQPAHPTLDPIYVDAANVQVQGRVVSVLRQIG